MGIIKCMNRECPHWDRDKLDNCGHAYVQIRVCKDSIVKHVKLDKYKNPYLNSLFSNECAGCGGKKSPKKSFCYSCYKKLPHDLQVDLYMRMGDGYEEAYDAGVKWLTEGRPIE